jgi:hypothetical protein
MALVGSLSGSLGLIAVTGSFVPSGSNLYSIGTSTNRWSNVVSTAFSGSLTKLADGTTDYLIGGSNITLTTGANGSVTIAATSTATTPGGADRNVQFNNAGAFDGDDEFSWSGSVLAVTGSVSASQGITGSNLFATSLTSTQVVFADAGGKLSGDAGLTYDKDNDILTGVVVKATTGFSGSLTKLTDGTSYLIAGTGIQITTGSSGAVTVTSTVAATTPSAPVRSIQFNEAGAFGGDDELIWTGTVLAVTGSVSASQGITGSDVFASSLTSTQVVFAGTGGKLTGDSGMTYNAGSDVLTVGTSTFGQNVTIAGDLTVNGTTTTINTTNLLVKDPIIVMASGSTGPNANGGIAIYSGSSGASGADLVIGRVANDTWGVGSLDTNNGTVTSVDSMSLVKMRASEFQVNGTSSVIKEVGGVLIASGSSVALSGSSIDFVKDGTKFAYVGVSTDVSPLSGLFPSADVTYNLGSPALRWQNIYTGDLHLRNERGDYTLIEEEDFLSIRFNKTGKRYKFVLERVPELDEK